MEATYEFRHNAVKSQINNLAGNIRNAYNDKEAVTKYLDTFIRNSPNIYKATLATVPLTKHPLCTNLTTVKTDRPKPTANYYPMVNFSSSTDMEWYRTLLRKEIPYWHKNKEKTDGHEIISYIYPVFRKSEPIIMLYILKLDFTKEENPVLFWNVQQKIFENQIALEEDEALKKYFLLREQAEQLEIENNKLEELKIAKEYYKTRQKELHEKIKELEKIIELRQKHKAKHQ
jgi:hypothetical protein